MRRAAAAALGVALAACSSEAPIAPVAPPAPWIRIDQPRKHALVVVIDTLRADVAARADTPHLDSLAATGQVARAWSAGTWTAPAVTSLFTGLPVRAHGWDFPFPRFMDPDTEQYPPLPDHPTLAEVLQGAGFQTTGLYGNRLLGQDLGFDRGFDTWRRTRDSRMARAVRREVGSWEDDERHLLYVHLLGPHHPLRPSGRTPSEHATSMARPHSLMKARDGDAARQAAYRDAYQRVVEDTDQRLGRILAALGDAREDTVVLVTSDHGELLGEHGEWGHEHHVWEPLTHVPFVADGLGPLPATLSTTAVPALVTAAVGVAHDWPEAGLSTGPLVSQRQGKVALTPDGTRKAIWDPEAFEGGVGAFDLSADPGERAHRPELVGPLEEARAAWEAAVPAVTLPPLPGGMSDDDLGMLEQLGYLGDDDE